MRSPFAAGTQRGWRANLLLLGSLVAALGCALAAAGCLTVTRPDYATRPTLLNPRWQADAFAEHLGVFEEVFQQGETVASEPVGEYVSAIMHEAWLQPAVEGRYRLRSLFGRPSGYVGYVGGKHPPISKEAVLVCADLSQEQAASEATALLEVARLYGIASQYTLMPERSVIFGLWPRLTGQDDPLAGLRAYLQQPTWRLDRVRAVIYVGLDARLRPEAQALLSERNIALYRVEASPAGSPAAGPGAETSEETPPVLRARRLAERTHQRLRAATLTSGKIMPALGDTLRVPPQEQP